MLGGVPGAALFAAHDEPGGAQYRQGLIKGFVGAEEVAKHLVRTNLGLVTVQDVTSQLEVLGVVVAFESRD